MGRCGDGVYAIMGVGGRGVSSTIPYHNTML